MRVFQGLLLFLFFSGALFGQDARLLQIRTVYIVPNSDEKETAQFKEKIPAELGWKVVYDRSEADALWVYQVGSRTFGAIIFPDPDVTTIHTLDAPIKAVQVYSNDDSPELLWQTQKKGLPKIAGTAVKRLRKEIAELRKTLGSQPVSNSTASNSSSRTLGLAEIMAAQSKKSKTPLTTSATAKPAPVDLTPSPNQRKPSRGFGGTSSHHTGYLTRIDSGEDDLFKLENGAVLELPAGGPAYVGFRPMTVLFRSGSRWRVWIEGHRDYQCDVLKAPIGGGEDVREVTISDVLADGSILKFEDGSIFEVDSLDTLETNLWFGLTKALLIDDSKVINLEDGDEPVAVTRLK